MFILAQFVPRVKWPECEADHSPTSLAPSLMHGATHQLPHVPSWCVEGLHLYPKGPGFVVNMTYCTTYLL